MTERRRFPLLVAVAVVLVATGLLTTWRHSSNPSTLPGGLTVSMNAESTALYCTGLTSASGAAGRVTFYNSAPASRNLSVSVVSSRGTTWHGTIELAAHAAQSLQPSVVDKGAVGDSYGVAVQISGGGVVGDEVAGTNHTEVPCRASGVTHWYATGFDTSTGSSATLSVYNPTATAAVFNASIYTATGVSAPESFQGISVPAHRQTVLNLDKEVVNTSNVGVGVMVLRGSLEIVGVEDSAGTTSLNEGETGPTDDAWFPNVTTVQAATAQIRLVNPNAAPANVTVDVTLSTYKIAPQIVTVAPFSSGTVSITPNSAIPAAGYAQVALHSNVPVVSALALGTASWFALSAPEAPSNEFLVRDVTGLGFDAATVTNTSSHPMTLTVATYHNATAKVIAVAGNVKLAAGATESLSPTMISSFTTPGSAYLISSSRSSMVVSLTLPSQPKGVYVVSALDGR